jgi:hypothetical protein
MILALLVCTGAATLFIGCGGGGGGGQPPQPPPQPPPEPPPTPVEIGPGPGPAADQIPAEPAISTVQARATAFMSSPAPTRMQQEAIDRIDRFAAVPPRTEAELRAVLGDFTSWATRRPNDVVSQAGLAASIVLAGAYNAGIDAGYTSERLLGMLDPVTQVASAGLTTDRSSSVGGLMQIAADFPDPSDPDFSSADLQIGIRKFLLPAVAHARARLQAAIDAADSRNTRLAEIRSRHGSHYVYRAELRMLEGMLRVGQGVLLQFCAYQFNPGDWDWTVPLAERDEDGDGVLTVDEYLPPDPFLWRHQSNTMEQGGTHLSEGLREMKFAVGKAPADSLLVHALRPDGPQPLVAKLRDLWELTENEMAVQIVHEGGLEGAARFTTTMDLRVLWEDPIDDLKVLFPTLTPVSGSHWEALPRERDDFPKPSFFGVFPQPARVLNMLTTGPTYIAINSGEVERLTVLDVRDEQN